MFFGEKSVEERKWRGKTWEHLAALSRGKTWRHWDALRVGSLDIGAAV